MPAESQVVCGESSAQLVLASKSMALLRVPENITIRDGAATCISDFNWVPDIPGGQPRLRLQDVGTSLRVKDLLCNGGTTWDSQVVKVLFMVEDAEKILKINTLNPSLPDRKKCAFMI
ncbi:cytochrome c-type biogenesis protein CcmE [Striga asiatica]|uniref:Cytochrome c-type biogenesis protein CcmE n=1 Tax=Striga asiatica TaxID=4170 RepID=A0A5A7QF06_STRAF|nr:cytochrome c-type biogenesis protein CcmE [Striga asiatica]